MRKIVECVPNFSEGRDKKVIEQIVEPIRKIDGVKLLDVNPDRDYNRVVVTFAGEPGAVLEAAMKSSETALKLIDMTKHSGEHPRLGAVDVVPFVPVSGVTTQDCIELANRYARNMADKFELPVFLYEDAATKEERRNLATIRKGEYEGLAEKLKDPNWMPDYGPAKFVPRSGAIVTGARFFLIAYNVNLKTKDKKIASRIAKTLRESGYKKTNEKGEKIRIPGRLKAVKGIGVYLDNYEICQVSMNLVNYEITPPHIAYEAVKEEAMKFGVEVSGSELIGLIPKEALIMAGKYYDEIDRRRQYIQPLTRQLNIMLDDYLPKEENTQNKIFIQIATEKLNLSDLYPVNIEERIIEYIVR